MSQEVSRCSNKATVLSSTHHLHIPGGKTEHTNASTRTYTHAPVSTDKGMALGGKIQEIEQVHADLAH